MKHEILNIWTTIDSADKKAIIGVAASMFFASVEGFDLLVKVIGGIGGLIFIGLGIFYRVLQIKEVKRKLKENDNPGTL